jgi:mannosyltransferase
MSAPSPATAPTARPAERLAGSAAGVLPVLAAITALGAGLRFATLTVQSYWLDEAVTVELVRKPLGAMLSAIPDSESTPPLYYLLAWLWTQLFGTGEAGLRSLSALIGAATIPLAYSAAARLVTPRVGVVVAALAAVNPLLIWFSQEARAYALLLLLCTAALAVFARLLERTTGRALAAWALLCALALAAHYFAFFVIAPQAAWLLWRSRGRVEWRGVLAACGAIALAGAALLPLLVHQARNDRADFIRESGVATRAAQLVKQYLVGYDAPLEAAATVVALALTAYGLWLLWRRADRDERRGAALAARIAVPALAAPLALAAVGIDYLITRNLIAAWVPAAIVLAAGFGARRAGRAGIAAAAALCVLSLAVFVAVESDRAYQRDDWRGVGDALGPAPAGGRAIVTSPFFGGVPLSLYVPMKPLPAGTASAAELDAVAVAERRQGQKPVPPHPVTPPPPPPGFAPAEVHEAPTYTLLRYRALSGSAPFTRDQLLALKLAPNIAATGLQAPPAR